ncbi:DUF3611 family protein [Leptolyngbya sp. FACHB-17]|uniref:DUF3611 family protein n=1 Tax=unclassified Leptolyngbya TaxID=2650499 RepID=UPI0016800235|nr:DUF3611 family protein [Leptolyngbya sp. FACHB-17]MBD2078655.1 DUF3611 family protein [Leptolyngbya sp. FACHB-17]
MQTPAVVESDSLSHKLEQIGKILRIIGWAGIVTQLGLAVAAGVMLVFAIAGRNFNQAVAIPTVPGVPAYNFRDATTPGLGIGIFWAVAGILVLLFTAYLAFRQLRFARRLRNPNPDLHPKKSDVMKVLRIGIIAGFVGMALTILGGGAALGVLLSKSIAIPQGVAVYAPTRVIRPLDVLIAMANMVGITAHFLGTIASVATVSWLHRQ